MVEREAGATSLIDEMKVVVRYRKRGVEREEKIERRQATRGC